MIVILEKKTERAFEVAISDLTKKNQRGLLKLNKYYNKFLFKYK